MHTERPFVAVRAALESPLSALVEPIDAARCQGLSYPSYQAALAVTGRACQLTSGTLELLAARFQ